MGSAGRGPIRWWSQSGSVGGELVDADGDVSVDGALQDGNFVDVGTERDDGVGPRLQLLLHRAAGALQRVGGVGRQVTRCGGVEDHDLLPGQVALGGLAVGGDEPDVDRAGTVVDVDDGADVVPVEGLDSRAWSGVAGGVVERGQLLDELVAADAVLLGGDAGSSAGDAELLDEFRQRPATGEGVDAGVVGVDAVGELLAA